MSFIEDYRHAKKYGQLRPWWQIVLLLPVYPIYAGMRWIVTKVEGW